MQRCACWILSVLFLAITGCAPTMSEPMPSPAKSALPNPTMAIKTPAPKPTERLLTIVLDPATQDNPYPVPRLTGKDWTSEELTDEMLNAFVSRFCFDLFDSCRTLVPPDFSAYIEDNVFTHLALRWSEYLIHEVKKSPRKQVIEITSVTTTGGKREERTDSIAYSALCELRYERKDPSVNGCNIDAAIEVAQSGGKLKIISMDLVFDSRYRDLLKKLRQEHPQELTIEQIDKAFEELMK